MSYRLRRNDEDRTIMTLRDRIAEYLAKHGDNTPTPIAEKLGEKPKSVQSTLRRMLVRGEVRQLDDGSYELLSAPETPGTKPLPTASTRRDAKVPAWTPGIDYDERGGELRTPPRVVVSSVPTDPEHVELFEQFGLSADKWEITSLRRSRWQTYDERWLEAYRATFAPRTASAALTEVDLENFLGSYGNTVRFNKIDSPETWMVPLGDLQLGKPDGGGTGGIVERFARCTEAVRADLERRGGVDRLILPWLGDCIEGLVSQSGRNVARLDRTLTEQVRTLRRLLLHQIGELAPYANKVLVVSVAGNHDEAYREQTMPPSDSWALDAASAVSDALSLTDQFSHAQFLFPEPEELGVTVDVGTEAHPYVIHFTHGHAARNPAKMTEWWAKQAHGRQQAGAADLLVTAHFHHFRMEQTGGGKTWLQIPALDGGSDYFRRRTGEECPAGVIQLRITGRGIGWDSLTIHE